MDESTQEIALCHCCSNQIDEDTSVQIDEHRYCENCVFQCHHCQEMEVIDNEHTIGYSEDISVCQNCFYNDVQTCSICDSYELSDNMLEIDDRIICQTCADENTAMCDECQERHLDENTVSTWDEQTLCTECAEAEGYTERCEICQYAAREQDLTELPTDIDQALKELAKRASMSVAFDEPTITAPVCKGCLSQSLSVMATIRENGSDREHLELIFPRKEPYQISLAQHPEQTKIAILSDAKYVMMPCFRENQRTEWVSKISNEVNFQIVSDEVFDKIAALERVNTAILAKIVNKSRLEEILVEALNNQDINALTLQERTVTHQARYNWTKRYPDEEFPTTTVVHIEVNPFDRLAFMIGEARMNQICPDWREKLHDLKEKITEHNRLVTLRLVEQNNNREGDNMRCSMCNSLIDENNKTANEACVCQRCIYGEMCPECKRNGYPVCPDCLINYGKQKSKLETKLFQLSNNNRMKRYHDSEDRFIKTTRLRMPDEKPYLYYGVELEMCIPFTMPIDNFAKEMLEAGRGLFVAEADSSLDNGVEFISRPLSYKKWKSQEVQQILAAMKSIAMKYKYDQMSQNSAGMHVHLSKLFFQKNTTKSQSEQIDDLNWIIQNYEKELRPITGREPGEYNSSIFASIERDLKSFIESRNIRQATITTKVDKTKVPIDHHSMVSMSGSGNTVEVRAFKGTCDPLTIMARIELCRNLAHFARKYDIENMTLDKAFSCKQSPFLEEYTKTNGIKVDSKKKLKSSQNVKIEVKR